MKLQKKKIIETQIIVNKKDYRPQPQNFYYLNPEWKKIPNYKLKTNQKQSLQKLEEKNTQFKTFSYLKKEILEFFSSHILKKMLSQKIILKEKKCLIQPKKIKINFDFNIKLNPKQNLFLKKINFNNYKNYLLYYNLYDDKITIYIKLIEHSLKKEKQVLIIVAEFILINLLKEQLEKKFPNVPMAIFKNDDNLEENYQKNIDIQKKRIFIIIGTRKIIFAPLSEIGVIIIDEENDDSLIERERNPNYDVKELAIIRAKYNKIPLIFFTTAPSIESFQLIKQKKISFFDIKNYKIKKQLKLINMKEELQKGNTEPLSLDLLNKLRENIKKNKKTILFINVRGFSPFVLCLSCNYVPKCKRCNRKLVLFTKPQKRLKCNFCNYIEIFRPKCYSCSQDTLKNIALGIEYIELFLKNKIKSIHLARIDSDSIKNFKSFQNILKKLNENEINVLLGTEMIAKNLKLPPIETVGILMIDVLLNMNSFKATEKTFQLLTKMTNYISNKGQIIIQGYNIKNAILEKFDNLDIFSPLKIIWEERKITNNPPFSFVSKILITNKDLTKILSITEKIKKILENNINHKIKVLGPNFPLFFYKNKNYRSLLTLKYNDWPLKLDFILENKLNENSFILFNRFASII
ncbi:MAG: primosomal protein N' [Candidatus Phytoplasma stylosanthis]|uniref:replication restart helicase PriA n=1 Tax=Candidatus Phytoplasma stylosanthis TaxID=2798314 RepID=UPI00293988ED|nr:primosomal protein N' [Candidatus Phytoplasma stylosanthis]MDV3168163.1 primosomal protein N' [Candidatus Phytoplasma stylosanthis]